MSNVDNALCATPYHVEMNKAAAAAAAAELCVSWKKVGTTKIEAWLSLGTMSMAVAGDSRSRTTSVTAVPDPSLYTEFKVKLCLDELRLFGYSVSQSYVTTELVSL